MIRLINILMLFCFILSFQKADCSIIYQSINENKLFLPVKNDSTFTLIVYTGSENTDDESVDPVSVTFLITNFESWNTILISQNEQTHINLTNYTLLPFLIDLPPPVL